VTGLAARRVLVWGDVIDDIVVRPHGAIRTDTDTVADITARPGGSAANVAAWLGSVGVSVDFVGRVGIGDLDRHAASLRERGVTPHLIADESLPTGTIVVLLDQNNHRTMLTQRGANRALTPTDVADELLAAASLTHFSGYTVFNGALDEATPGAGEQDFRNFITRATRAGTAVSVDPGSAGFLRDYGPSRFLSAIAGTTILLPNYDEGAVLTGLDDPIAIAAELGRAFPIVVVTVGERGTIVAAHGDEPVVLPVKSVHKADTTGAGDAFSAGFIAAWLDGGDAVASATSASDLAASSLALIGGRPA
jgi:sugar/nucleoside kinase (ribokinase family)